jgi:hypothetical protein
VPPESQQDQQKKKIGRPRKYDDDFRQAALERMKTSQDVSALALELDFFKGALLRIEENRRKRERTSGKPSTSKSDTRTGSKAN